MKKKKLWYVIAGLVVITCIALLAIFIFSKKDAYRIIKIYEFEGDGIVKRESVGEIEPYNNMVLESRDVVKLNTGLMTLKLDDDKYVYVEENTEFLIEAKGTSEDSKTTIILKSGAITSDIQNKLSDESTYEINTPNSTISVRGTKYRVGLYEDEKGVKYSRISVFEGTVSTKITYADGTVSEQELSVNSGKEVTIYSDDTTADYFGDVTDIDYSTLPKSVGGELDDSAQTITDVPENGDSDTTESTSEEVTESDLTDEEIEKIAIFAKYIAATQAARAESIEGMPLQMSDEVVINTMGILANDYMSVVNSEKLEPYVIETNHEGGVMRLSKEQIDQYVFALFDYSDIVYYEIGSVMAGSDGCEIWESQGYCDATIIINETYMDGENYVVKGVANLNYEDIFDPQFMDVEFTFTVRRNPDSPFGFTYVNMVFGTVLNY